MATTSPDNLLTPDAGDQYALVQDLGLLADSVQDALNLRANAVIGTVAERGSFANPVAGMLWQDTDGIKMIWRYDSGSWVPAIWRWGGTTAQMNSFSPPDGFEWFNTTDNGEYVRLSGVWSTLARTSHIITHTATIGANASISGTWNYPNGPYLSVPTVNYYGTPQSSAVFPFIRNRNTTSAGYSLVNPLTSPTGNVTWQIYVDVIGWK